MSGLGTLALLVLPSVLRAAGAPQASVPPATQVPGPAAATQEKSVLVTSSPPLPPIETAFLQYGVSFAGEFVTTAGAMCKNPSVPCILGSGGGIGAQAGIRSASPWYLGLAYEMTKQDSSTIFRFATLQQLRFESRYYLATGRITQPFASLGGGVVAYGDEWGISTAGPVAGVRLGVEVELSRREVVAMTLGYRLAHLAPFTDSSLTYRDGSFVQMVGLDVSLEVLDPR